MCGIIGYMGRHKAFPILIRVLKRLEYRIYNSVGVILFYDRLQQYVHNVKGKVIALVSQGGAVISKITDICIEFTETLECHSPLLTTLPLQLMAYHIATYKGMDVDQPRNLAKSVTVE